MTRQLRIIAGPDADKVFPLPDSGTVQLGRGKDTLTQLEDLTVSRTHCQLDLTDGKVVITNSSDSGTLVNQEPITQRELQPGDTIQLGKTKLRYEVVDICDVATLRGNDLKEMLAGEVNRLSGTELAHFRVGRLIAEGESGPVYRAQDTKASREVTLKVFPLATVPSVAFPQVLKPVLGLAHPNLLTLYEAGRASVYIWVAMEYVEGESLEKQLEQLGPAGMMDWQHVVRFGIHLASALEALHQGQVVHRDITPRNIVIARSDRQAKLGGLWRARALKDCRAESDTKDVLHSVKYMPPERLRAGEPATPRGDIYSLGAVLYTLLAGRPPFEGQTQAEIIKQIVQTAPVPPTEFQLSLPDAFGHAILRMLAKRPEDRYSSAGELLTALQQMTGAKPPTAQQSAPRPTVAEGKILVTCTCGQQLQARKQFAGTQVRCPCCGSFILLPGRTPVGKPQELRKAQPGTPPGPQLASRSLWRHELVRYGILVIFMVVTLLISLAGIFWDNSARRSPPDKRTPETAPVPPNPKNTSQPP